jgi:hypothetical protein
MCGGMLERPRYFPRQIVTHGDLNLEADYFRARLRRHNRLLHGWGVVCGARVCRIDCPDGSGFKAWRLRVTSGYILGPFGDEILIDGDRTFDLRTAGLSVGAETWDGDDDYGSDPWCSDVQEDRERGKLFLAVRYKEMAIRPVRPQPAGCGCNDDACEQSRWCDGYELRVLDCCPPSHTRGGRHGHNGGYGSWRPSSSGHPPRSGWNDPDQPWYEGSDAYLDACPVCPTDPWVVLAEIEIDDDGRIVRIDNCSCRRIVVSFASVWGSCGATAIRCDGATTETPGPYRPGVTVSFVVTGQNFPPTVEDVDLGQGIDVDKSSIQVTGPTTVRFTAMIRQDALPGPRNLTIATEDCSSATCTGVIQVDSPEQPEATPRPNRRRRANI